MMSPVGVPAAAATAATDEAAEAVLKWPPVLITTTPANIKYIKIMTKLTLHYGLITCYFMVKCIFFKFCSFFRVASLFAVGLDNRKVGADNRNRRGGANFSFKK